MSLDSAEYRTLQSHTNDLRLAVKADLIGLSGDVFGAGLITKETCDGIADRMHSKEERAASLVGFVQDKVQESPQNYHIFIGVLRQRGLSQYGDILRKLKDTYKGVFSV